MNESDRRSNGGLRRAFLKGCATVATLTLGPRIAWADDQNWSTFKRRFIQNGERVVDTGNNDVSHSESQGWGMLFAESNGDKETLQKLWEWTSKTLQRGDGLFSWRWSPKVAEPVADKNNAADGDVLIAWALARAAKRWEEPRWAANAQTIQAAILDQLAIEFQGRLILLPAAQGFTRGERRIVNLSYYVWPAIHDFAQSAGGEQARWRRLEADGLWLLDNAAFGTYRLPPDWLSIGSQEPRIADGWPPYFGFDAVRIPLYLAWRNEQARLGRFLSAWQTPQFGGKPPAWINLKDGSVAPFPSSGGYEAVLVLTQFVSDGMQTKPPFATLTDTDDYYSASLKLLSNIAVREAPLAKRT
jgi:endo-1,4-beta-D-glucanase Y